MESNHLTRSVLLSYTATDLFDLVSAVNTYEEFLPWCKRSTIQRRQGHEVIASMQISVAGHLEEIVTCNRLFPYKKIELEFLEGPFSIFNGEWKFEDLGIGCKVTLDLEFALKRRIRNYVTAQFLDKGIDRVLTSFTDRAKEILLPCA